MVTTRNQTSSSAFAYNTTAMSVPPSIGLREFIRGGYKHLDEPTVVYDATHTAIGTWIPGVIGHEFEWSTDDPVWLREEGQ